MLKRFAAPSVCVATSVFLCACQPKTEEAKPAPAVAVEPAPPQAVIPTNCSIMNAYGWEASVNAQPPERPRLSVSSLVVTSTAGYKVELSRKAVDINPKIVTLDLVVTPPTGPASQVLTTQKAFVTVPDTSRTIDKVVIRCGGETLTEISPVPTHD
ncbi:MAG: hypothetical protein ACREE0_04305 [Phenylobacterium sp.]